MRGIGFILDKAVKIRQPHIPEKRLVRAFETQWRQLDDDSATAFNSACAAGDLDAAADLLSLMEAWHAKRTYRDSAEQRLRGTLLMRLRCELDRQHLMKGTAPLHRPDRMNYTPEMNPPSGSR